MLTRRLARKTYSLVSVFAPNSKGLCLEIKTGWFGKHSVGMGACRRQGSQEWLFDFVGAENVKLYTNSFQLTRGVPYRNSISIRDITTDIHLPLLQYHSTAIHDAGFFLKSSDGLCFDGGSFVRCNNITSLLWGLGIRYDKKGEVSRYIHNFKDRRVCIEAKENIPFRGFLIADHCISNDCPAR